MYERAQVGSKKEIKRGFSEKKVYGTGPRGSKKKIKRGFSEKQSIWNGPKRPQEEFQDRFQKKEGRRQQGWLTLAYLARPRVSEGFGAPRLQKHCKTQVRRALAILGKSEAQ